MGTDIGMYDFVLQALHVDRRIDQLDVNVFAVHGNDASGGKSVRTHDLGLRFARTMLAILTPGYHLPPLRGSPSLC